MADRLFIACAPELGGHPECRPRSASDLPRLAAIALILRRSQEKSIAGEIEDAGAMHRRKPYRRIGQDPANRRKRGKASLQHQQHLAAKSQCEENPMREMLASSLILFAWAVPALAQDAPPDQGPAPNAAQEQHDKLAQMLQTIERSVQSSLARQGFTEIQMIPTSFLIRAKDRDGNPVMLTLGPGSVGESEGKAPDPQSEPDDDVDAPTFQPLATVPPAIEVK
jgi:hypothetical protein